MKTLREVYDEALEVGDFVFYLDQNKIDKIKISLIELWVGEVKGKQGGYDILYKDINGVEINHHECFKSIKDLTSYYEEILNTGTS